MIRACIILWVAISIAGFGNSDWGFFSHRLINKMAVFTLPPDLIPFYKVNIEFISAHAIDPDKRRYATRHEGSRHYIDLDRWGTFPFDTLPRDWITALGTLIQYHRVNQAGDTLLLSIDSKSREKNIQWVYRHILPKYYDDQRIVKCDTFKTYFENVNCDDCLEIIFSDQLSTHGILPYHLVKAQRNLTEAFRQGNEQRILSLSADLGHYIADAHVPLHTTENYNGQLTDQKGIHAFWESRIPELFADQYDFLTGRASYIDDPVEYYWNIVLHSNSLVDSVFSVEKELSQSTKSDMRFCFVERSQIIVRTQCADYAKAYSAALNDMVERQMRSTVHAVGSAWFTAWVDAGQPQISRSAIVQSDDIKSELQNLEKEFRSGKIKGRSH